MRSLNISPQMNGFIYSKATELLLIGLLLVFIYPFFFLISGVDPTVPPEQQSQIKIVYFLREAFPLFCVAIAWMCRRSEIYLPGVSVIYPIICLASSAWSVDPYVTFKFATVMFLYVLAIAAICQVLDIDA